MSQTVIPQYLTREMRVTTSCTVVQILVTSGTQNHLSVKSVTSTLYGIYSNYGKTNDTQLS